MKLPGLVVGRLVEAISDAYTVDELQMFLAIRLERDLDESSSASQVKPLRIFKMIESAGRKGWTCDLLEKLYDHGENPELVDLSLVLSEEYCGAPGMTPLTDDQIWILCNEIHISFTIERLEAFVNDSLGRDLGRIVSARQRKAARIFKLVDVSQKEGWTGELITALLVNFPENPKFAVIAANLGLAAAPELGVIQ